MSYGTVQQVGSLYKIDCKPIPKIKKNMITIINGNEEEVVYIDYKKGNIPHQVYTADSDGWMHSWDFFCNNGDKKDISFYNSGSGGNKKSIEASNWAKGFKGKYWLGQGCDLNGKSNGIKLEKPLRIKGYYCSSINPFKVGEETNSREYCEKCEFESTEFCYKHKYEDNEGNERWISDNKYSG
jgi:hypothetical protein